MKNINLFPVAFALVIILFTSGLYSKSVNPEFPEYNISLGDSLSDESFVNAISKIRLFPGYSISQIPNDFTVIKEIRTIEEGNEIPVYIIQKAEKTVFEVFTSFIPEKGIYNDTISEVYILTDQFKSSKGFGAGSSLRSFMKTYPDSKIWYTYVSNRFVLESPYFPNTQFIIENAGYNGDVSKLNYNDMIFLDAYKFRKGTKIRKIRIYSE